MPPVNARRAKLGGGDGTKRGAEGDDVERVREPECADDSESTAACCWLLKSSFLGEYFLGEVKPIPRCPTRGVLKKSTPRLKLNVRKTVYSSSYTSSFAALLLPYFGMNENVRFLVIPFFRIGLLVVEEEEDEEESNSDFNS